MLFFIRRQLKSSTQLLRSKQFLKSKPKISNSSRISSNDFKARSSSTLSDTILINGGRGGACFIQAAWRRFKKRKLAKELMARESNYYYRTLGDEDGYYYHIDDVVEGLLDYEGIDDSVERISTSAMDSPGSRQQLGATILASRFAKNTRKGTKVALLDPSAASLKMPKLFKPDEPDFSVDHIENV